MPRLKYQLFGREGLMRLARGTDLNHDTFDNIALLRRGLRLKLLDKSALRCYILKNEELD